MLVDDIVDDVVDKLKIHDASGEEDPAEAGKMFGDTLQLLTELFSQLQEEGSDGEDAADGSDGKAGEQALHGEMKAFEQAMQSLGDDPVKAMMSLFGSSAPPPPEKDEFMSALADNETGEENESVVGDVMNGALDIFSQKTNEKQQAPVMAMPGGQPSGVSSPRNMAAGLAGLAGFGSMLGGGKSLAAKKGKKGGLSFSPSMTGAAAAAAAIGQDETQSYESMDAIMSLMTTFFQSMSCRSVLHEPFLSLKSAYQKFLNSALIEKLTDEECEAVAAQHEVIGNLCHIFHSELAFENEILQAHGLPTLRDPERTRIAGEMPPSDDDEDNLDKLPASKRKEIERVRAANCAKVGPLMTKFEQLGPVPKEVAELMSRGIPGFDVSLFERQKQEAEEEEEGAD